MTYSPKKDSRQIKEKLLKHALSCFAESGYDGASIRKIAEDAEVNYQAITYYFKNKHQLWMETAEYGLSEMKRDLVFPPGILETLHPRQQFEMRMRSEIIIGAKHIEIHRMIMREAMKQSDRYKQIFESSIAPMTVALREMFDNAQAAGVIRSDLPAEYLISIYFGAAFWRLVAPYESLYDSGLDVTDPDVISAHADTVIKLFELPTEP